MIELKPITFRAACAFVAELHRHHKPPRGHKFSISIVDENEKIRGVAMIGRPVSRVLDNGYIAEVNRVCTDGVKNGCSMLYGAAWRACRAMGYKGVVTYILKSESGISLRASGWRCDGQMRANGKGWNNRRDRLKINQDEKVRWSRGIIESSERQSDDP